jgi:MFS family permease
MLEYLRYILSNPRLLAFGFLLTLGSSFGQTYFIALFSDELRATFELGHGAFGSVYSLATLTSAGLMLLVGHLIDRVDLRLYSALVCALMIAAAVFMWQLPAGSIAYLYVAFLLLRFGGQGLLSHTGLTAVARYSTTGRGKGIAVAALGYSVGEAILPLAVISLVALFDWHTVWGFIALALAVVLLPLSQFLLRGHGARHAALMAQIDGMGSEATDRQFTRGQVLRDGFFWLLLPAVLAPAFINTGIFFNQRTIVSEMGWDMRLFALGFTAYAIVTVISSLASGPLIDRLGARRVYPYVLLPLGVALIVLGLFDAPVVAILFMALAGMSAGVHHTATTALWAEIYGVRHLGSIKAMAASLMVFSTALSPASMGWLIDAGLSMATIALLCCGWVVVATLLILVAVRRRPAIAVPVSPSGA